MGTESTSSSRRSKLGDGCSARVATAPSSRKDTACLVRVGVRVRVGVGVGVRVGVRVRVRVGVGVRGKFRG